MIGHLSSQKKTKGMFCHYMNVLLLPYFSLALTAASLLSPSPRGSKAGGAENTPADVSKEERGGRARSHDQRFEKAALYTGDCVTLGRRQD